jgi:hypothetical protein
MATSKKSGSGAWTCPQCGVEVPAGFLLCDCGYHEQTDRNVGDELDDDAEQMRGDRPPDSRELVTLSMLERDGAESYPWLERGSRLMVWFAYICAISATIALLILANEFASAKHEPGSVAESDARWAFFSGALYIILWGSGSFIVLRSLADLARALLASTGALARRLSR